jgi:hypothetical protein
MVTRRAPVTIWHWRKANNALQQSLRAGDKENAKRWAHTLLLYLGEMGLINDDDRQLHTDRCGLTTANPVVKKKG